MRHEYESHNAYIKKIQVIKKSQYTEQAAYLPINVSKPVISLSSVTAYTNYTRNNGNT